MRIRSLFLLAGCCTGLATQGAKAQSQATDRGSMAISGSASFSSSKAPGSAQRTTVLDLRPALQYFVVPGVAVGGQLVLGRSTAGRIHSTAFGIGPTISFYFRDFSPRVQPFLAAGFSLTENNLDAPAGDQDVTNTELGGSAGLLLLLTSSVGINAQLYYRHLNVSSDFADLDGDSYGLSFGVAAFVF